MFGDQFPHSDIQCDKDNSWECERPIECRVVNPT